VDAHVPCLPQPRQDIAGERLQRGRGEVETEQDIASEGANAALDLACGLRPVGATGLRPEAVVVGEVREAAIPDDTALRGAVVHGRLEIVVEQFRRYAADVGEGVDMAAQEGLEVLAQGERAVLATAVVEREHEGRKGAAPLVPGQR
jgi:hypothetical protein